ncbi:MAG: tRNA (cytidine(34)-2'-O)-methyltransferase [bacterium]
MTALDNPPFHLVLVHAEIPPNTGNVARLCAVTGCQLHLVEPLGFRLEDRDLKRAGLDYWDELKVQVWPDLEAYLAGSAQARHWWCTTKASRLVPEVPFERGDHLVFGPETRGLPPELIASDPEHAIRIPMRPKLRSLNLSTAVGIVTYAALGCVGYPGLE